MQINEWDKVRTADLDYCEDDYAENDCFCDGVAACKNVDEWIAEFLRCEVEY